MTIFSIYIPRMLGTVTREVVYDAFDCLNIGYITELNMYRKINENSNAYYIAFITLRLYDTNQATHFKNRLNQNQIVRLTYDEEAGQYWEIKKYISKDKRKYNNGKIVSPEYKPIAYPSIFNSSPNNIWKCDVNTIKYYYNNYNNNKSSFTRDEIFDLDEDYKEIEKEIFNIQQLQCI